MVYQLRIYTVNKGMMDSFAKLFNEKLRPIHEKAGIPVVAAWMNADHTEFIWVRRFNSKEEIPEKEAAYFAHPERKALGNLPPSHIAKMEVRVIEDALVPAGVR